MLYQPLQVLLEVIADLLVDVDVAIASCDEMIAVGIYHHVEIKIVLHKGFSYLVGVLGMNVVVGCAGDDEDLALKVLGTA